MMLALDYDETYTRDPQFWDAVIELAKARGHSIICATMRYETEGEDVRRDLAHQVEAIVYTGRRAKYWAVHDAGYLPSVWIDDSPNWIFTDANY